MENFENREGFIDQLILQFAERQEMTLEDLQSDIITFAPYEGNEDPNLAYFEIVAEGIGISLEEMTAYAVKKAEDHFREE